MWDTRETDFNIMNSPFKKDILQMLSKECRRRRFPLGIYYSVGDWHHPNYPNQGRSHELPGPEKGDEPDLKKYLAYLKAQVRELCTQYGPICEFWWDSNQTEHTDPSINRMIRSLQPKAVINNRGFDEGDFGTPERESDKAAGETAFPRPMEACNSTGVQSWGYKSDEDYYSLRHLIKSIDSIMARGGNYLLNVGPKADGTVPQASRKILKSIGKWYKSVKESFSAELIPDMRGSGLKIDKTLLPELFKTPGVLAAKKGRVFYMHLNEFPKSEALVLNPVMEAPKKAVLLNTGKEVQFGLDSIPSLWTFKGKKLRVRKLPVNRLSNEVIVLKMNF
jgi:alpha-L-fucosidase